MRDHDHDGSENMRVNVQFVNFTSTGEFDIENVNATKVECNGLLGSAGDDTKVNRDF